jgi:hypothetical protein
MMLEKLSTLPDNVSLCFKRHLRQFAVLGNWKKIAISTAPVGLTNPTVRNFPGLDLPIQTEQMGYFILSASLSPFLMTNLTTDFFPATQKRYPKLSQRAYVLGGTLLRVAEVLGEWWGVHYHITIHKSAQKTMR